MEQFMTAEFWLAVGQIIMIDILLGGDNAVVIALACRKLPPAQRKAGILWGTAGAIVLRVVLIFFALTLLKLPFLKIVGALLLLWIGIKLLLPEDEGDHDIQASDKLWAAVKTVIVADFVMSLDNVIAIAGAAEGAGGGHQMPLVIFGLLVSIPIIVWGSQLVIKLMDRFPLIITLGGMLLGWIAGGMMISDPAVKDMLAPYASWLQYGAPAAGALLVLAVGKWIAARARPAAAEAAARLAPSARVDRVLLPVDGSDGALAAVRQVIALAQAHPQPAAFSVDLVNVQPALSRDVSSFVAGKTLQEYHGERSAEDLTGARHLLDAAGLTYRVHTRVGQAAAEICDLARELAVDQIVIGTRGQGAAAAAIMGSVASETVEKAPVPVLVVKN
ncbi:MAG: YjbE family putative metal transport protein [Leptothrix sp. (in: Bacteria)]|jgi:YjbE family integral membrane protein|nr:YjbE family putative metal transport protein [Leptothrix sp. (in: b-proteobacteria)]